MLLDLGGVGMHCAMLFSLCVLVGCRPRGHFLYSQAYAANKATPWPDSVVRGNIPHNLDTIAQLFHRQFTHFERACTVGLPEAFLHPYSQRVSEAMRSLIVLLRAYEQQILDSHRHGIFLRRKKVRQLGDARQRPGKQEKNKIEKTRKIVFCLIVFDGLSLGDLYGYFMKGVTKKRDGPIDGVLFEALAGRLICFGERDVNPRVIQTRRIGGPGRR